MGKRIIAQKRGRGSHTYKAPSHRYKGKIKMLGMHKGIMKGEIKDLVSCRGHDAPLMQVKYENGSVVLLPAPEGIRTKDKVSSGETKNIRPGNVLSLKNIPEGTSIYNIEFFFFS